MSLISDAFREVPDLQSRIQSAAARDASQTELFNDVSQHVILLKHEIRSLKRKLDEVASAQEPAEKRRKLPTGNHDATPSAGVTNIAAARGTGWASARPRFSAEDLSFSMPVRKKLRLEIVPAGPGTDGGIRGRNNTTGEDEVTMTWNDIDQIICVPIPEKAQPAFNFVVFASPESANAQDPSEPIVWTVPGTAPKGIVFNDGNIVEDGETYEGVITRMLNQELSKFGKSIIVPQPEEFASSMVQAHRKGEKAWHVKAWRGSKEGFLYFLAPGILFGFKKPLLFFPFSSINHISYTSVLQRTFNLNISAILSSSLPSQTDAQEFEFAMIDQADFAGIDTYVKMHGLNDASLAESRRAKRFNVNPPPESASAAQGDANGAVPPGAESNGVAEDGEGELARAERELQDAEDEEEEDYEVSGGETDGSGSSDEEEGGEENEGEEVEQYEGDEHYAEDDV